MKIVGSYNIKGGVGKTATAVNLAYLAAMDGYRTLVWDLDPQGAASYYFRIKPRSFPVMANLPISVQKKERMKRFPPIKPMSRINGVSIILFCQ